MSSFRVRWVLSCTVAELIGLGFGAGVGVLVQPLLASAPSVWMKVALFLAAASIGVVEGGALGLLQGRALHRRLPRLRPIEWAAPTVLFAVVGWSVGMIRPILHQGELAAGAAASAPSAEPPLAVVLALAGVLGAAAGALIGVAQWSVLRRHAPRAARWIPVNAVAWALAMVAIFAGFTLPGDAASGATRVVLGLAGGATGGLLLGLATAPLAARVEPWVDEVGAPLRGRFAAVTGASSGIGFEIALGLARVGAETILLGRDAARLETACAAIAARVSDAKLHAVVVDLGEDASIDRAAIAIRGLAPRLDVLVHDAAAMFERRTLSASGAEATLAVDALGPARLTAALDDRLKPGARVAVLTGIYQRRGEVRLDDPTFSNRAYSSGAANAQAQRARFLLVSALAARRPDLSVFAVHPGAVRTAALDRAPLWARVLAATLARPAFVRPELGALPVLRLLTTKEPLPSGRFWNRFSLERDAPTTDERRALAARPLFV